MKVWEKLKDILFEQSIIINSKDELEIFLKANSTIPCDIEKNLNILSGSDEKYTNVCPSTDCLECLEDYLETEVE